MKTMKMVDSQELYTKYLLSRPGKINISIIHPNFVNGTSLISGTSLPTRAFAMMHFPNKGT
jgi:hypothetical protein